MKNSIPTPRRRFIQGAVLAGALSLSPGSMRAANKASNHLRVGVIGLSRGVAHVRRFAETSGVEVAYAELMMSGVTTLVDLSAAADWWVDLAARSGMRAVLGPGFASEVHAARYGRVQRRRRHRTVVGVLVVGEGGGARRSPSRRRGAEQTDRRRRR